MINYCKKCGRALKIEVYETREFNEDTGERIAKAEKVCLHKNHSWDAHTKIKGRYLMDTKRFQRLVYHPQWNMYMWIDV